jgi:hypothetical protein
MENEAIDNVEEGDIVDFISPVNKVTSPVKAVNNEKRQVLINFFEDPELVIDRVNKWVSFDLLKITQKRESE